MTYEPHPIAKAAQVAASAEHAVRTDRAVRVIGEGASLIALALAGSSGQEMMAFSFSDSWIRVRPLAPTFTLINQVLFGYLDEAFREAGWEVRALDGSVEIHTYLRPDD